MPPSENGFASETTTDNQVLSNPNLWILFGITLTSVMGLATVAPSLPGIMGELQVSSSAVAMVLTAYTLPGVLLAPLFGVLADRIGRKRILVPAIVAFGLFGGACSKALDFNTLILFRTLQGIPAGAIASLNWTVMSEIFEGYDRVKVLGYNTAVLSIGSMLFPLIGGTLAEYHWSASFLIHFIAVPFALVVWSQLKIPKRTVKHEKLKEYFKVSFSIIRRPLVLALIGSRVLTFGLKYGFFVAFVPIILNQRFGSTPWITGLLLSSVALSTVLIAGFMGKLNKFLSIEMWVFISYIIMGLSLLTIAITPCLIVMFIPAILWGIGSGLNIPPTISLLSTQSPPQYRAIIMSLNGMSVRLGQTIGPVVASLLLVVTSLDGIFWWGAAMALFFGSGIALVLTRNHVDPNVA